MLQYLSAPAEKTSGWEKELLLSFIVHSVCSQSGSDSSPLSTATRSAVRGLIAAAAEREEKRLSTRQALSPSCAKPSLLAFQLSATILAVCFFSSAHYRPLALVPAQAMPSSRFERFQHKHHAYLQAFVRPLSGWRQASLTWPGHRD